MENEQIVERELEKNINVEMEENSAVINLARRLGNMFDKKELAKKILELQPCYYDKARNWWLWNRPQTKWERVDETDILNAIETQATINTVNSKEKNEMLEALKQESRKDAPAKIKPTWIQFKNTIYDIKTGEERRAMPCWFVTNPIPYELHEKRYIETPKIDQIFEEWVGKENVKKLYEIIAYCMLPDYPIHRIFCFIGSGMNGKSKYLELLRKFIGEDNCCSTELDTLLNSRFEVTRLHKKLVCQMGETNFGEISKTSMLKKLSGGDLIGFEYKGKDLFDEFNYAKLIIATNNLPATTDKTVGFYRRWMIIDFPNQFTEEKDILAEIPEEEYRCLAIKCSMILKDLIDQRKFTNEGTIEERMEQYESKSNFIESFLKEHTANDFNEYITCADFYKKFLAWSKENRHREMSETSVGLAVKKMGIEQEKKYFNWMYDGKGGQARVWAGIKWKN